MCCCGGRSWADLGCFTVTLAAHDMLDAVEDIARLCLHRVKGGYTFVQDPPTAKVLCTPAWAPTEVGQRSPAYQKLPVACRVASMSLHPGQPDMPCPFLTTGWSKALTWLVGMLARHARMG